MEWQAQAGARLRGAGHRAGAARAGLIDYQAPQSCCKSAQEIHAGLSQSGTRVGLASVYRVLDVLAEHGLVQRIDLGDGVARYEAADPGGAHHHHLVCDACGKVEPFADPQLEQAIEAVEDRSGFSVIAHDVVLRGACEACR
jgi:Fur family ferric uptake transcriptional regulator